MIAIPALDFSSINLEAFRQRLREIISVFNEIDQTLQHRVIDFLISGHDVEVLLDLRAALRQPDRPKFFKIGDRGLESINLKIACRLLRLFDQPITPEGYYHRLGQVCSQYPDLDSARTQADSRMPRWFNDLVRFALSLKLGSASDVSWNEQNCDLGPALRGLTQDESEQLLFVLLDSYDGGLTKLGAGLGQFSGRSTFIEMNIERLIEIVRPVEEMHTRLVTMLDHTFANPGQRLGEVIDFGLAISRNYRSHFQAILERQRAAAKPILLDRLTNGTPAQRMRSAEWLNKLYGKSIAEQLGQALESEQDRKVRAVIEPLYSVYREAAEYEQALAKLLTLPPVAMPRGELPLPTGFAVKFQSFLDKAIVRSREQYKLDLQSYALSATTVGTGKLLRPEPPSADDLLTLYLYIEGKSATKPPKHDWLYRVLQEAAHIDQWCIPQSLHLLHVMRLLDAIGSLQERSSALTVYHFKLLNEHRQAQAEPYGLREIDAAAEQIIGRPHLMSRGYLMEAARYELSAQEIWPAFVDQLKLLEDSINGVPLDQFDRDVLGRRQTALAIAGMLPVLPKQLEDAAWSLALGEAWTLRPLARPLLKRQANCLQRAIAGLAQRSCGAKMGAAELLQELGQAEAIEPLKKALKKEKYRPVQGSLLATLEKLGANVDEFVGREKLLQDATKGVRRPPRSMMWFPMDKLPVVRWAADNQPLEPIILRWWLIQCVEFKSIACSPIMRRALELCRRDDTLRLAHFILDQWIAFDTDEPDRIELEKRYRAEAEKLIKIFAKSTKMINIEEYVGRMVTQELRDIQRQQSAHTERGMLSIVAGFGDAKCVEKIEKYIRNYHGNRALQAKSMLEVIPQIDEPISLRVICSLAAGFRNAAICKRAGELLREMSQRYGWTEDELAERIIPDAGFANLPLSDPAPASLSAPKSESSVSIQHHSVERPAMLLSYGHRHFSIVLDDELMPRVIHEDGTQTKELPTATKTDDKTLVRVAKEQLKTARQILQTTKEQLTERLYQAMCSGRAWSVKDWRELLAGHVLAGVLCQRLVWSGHDAPVIASSASSTTASTTAAPSQVFFQLQPDGSLIDADGRPVSLPEDGQIRVAHPQQMTLQAEQNWITRWTEQNIRPLFSQTRAALSEESRLKE